MRKMTVCLPDDLKTAVKREAARRQSSESAVIRDAIAKAASKFERPKPRGGFLSEDWGPIDWNNNDWLEGFGEL